MALGGRVPELPPQGRGTLLFPPDAKGKRMSYRGENNDTGRDLDIYGDGDEATLRRDAGRDAELEHYDEDDIATIPWTRRLC